MFEILLTVCSVLEGAACHQASLVYADEGQSAMPYACMVGALPELAKWQAEHPNFSIARWQCGVAGRFAKA